MHWVYHYIELHNYFFRWFDQCLITIIMSIWWVGLTIQTYPRSIILQIQDRNRNSYCCRVALMGNLYTWHYWTRPLRVVRLDLWPQSFYIYRQQHRWTRWFRWRLPMRTTPLSPPRRSSPQSYCNRQKHNHVLWTIVEYNSKCYSLYTLVKYQYIFP